jgi:hypothetical protein
MKQQTAGLSREREARFSLGASVSAPQKARFGIL